MTMPTQSQFVRGAGTLKCESLQAKPTGANERVYVGSKEQLVAANLIVADQFPGEPGRGKMLATYTSDGSPIRQGSSPGRRERSGAYEIRRLWRNKFKLTVSCRKSDSHAVSNDPGTSDPPRVERLKSISAERPSRGPSASITRLAEYRNRDMIDSLEDLLQMARNGEVTGLMFTAHKHTRDHLLGVTGSYRSDMMATLAASSRLVHLTNCKITSERDD